MKKWIKIAGLLMLSLPVALQAGDYTYITNSDNTITITGYTGVGGAVTITNSINGLPVTSIRATSFYNNINLTSITIPNSVTNIGSRAFGADLKLSTITVDSLNLFYSSTNGVLFDKNQTTLITCPGGKTGSYTIPSGVTKILDYALNNCKSLISVTIPSSVTNIGGSAFTYSDSLTTIAVDALNTFYSSTNGVLFDKSQTKLLFYPNGMAGDYAIPNGVISIGTRAFEHSLQVTSITMPSSVVNIEDLALASCFFHLTNVTISANVTNIGNNAFYHATGLTSITIPNRVASIGNYAFYSCTGLTNVVIGNSVRNIGTYAFYNCLSLTNCNIPASVATIGDYVFWSCTGLTAITVDTNNSIYSSANGILFNKNQTVLKIYPAGKVGLYYTIPNSVTNVGNGAFAHCDITGVAIPNSVTTFGYRAFHYCLSLTNIMFSANVTSIGNEAIRGCDSLAAVIVDTNNTFYSSLDGALFNKSQTSLIQYPAGKTSTDYTIPSSVTNIGNYAFDPARRLINVVIPSNVTTIGRYAFDRCDSLAAITIGGSVTSLGDGVFYGCHNLSEIYFQGNAPSLGTAVFSDTTNAVFYYLPNATGWDTTFGGRPTVLWNPQIQTSGESFGVSTNGFGFNIAGTNNFTVVVEACTNLASGIWKPVKTNTLTGGSVQFSDPAFTNYPKRYYRVSMPQ